MPVLDENVVDVVMEGGKPWGFRLQGGKTSSFPLRLAQVTQGSKASKVGLCTGMEILLINGADTKYLTMNEAQDLVKETGLTLKLRIKNNNTWNVENGTPNIRPIVLKGFKPWGVRLMGGKDTVHEMTIGAVTEGSKACISGIKNGSRLYSINDVRTDELTREDAENLIKGTGNSLKLELLVDFEYSVNHYSVSNDYPDATHEYPSDEFAHNHPCFNQVNESISGAQQDNEPRDPAFINELRESFSEERRTSEVHEAKGNTFFMMKDHLDAGIGQHVLTVFDVDPSKRNKSIPTTAPKVNKQDSVDKGNNTGYTRTILLTGSKPWGLRLKGGIDYGSPLTIACVTEGSKAYKEGLLADDVILSINDLSGEGMSLIDAQELIKNTGNTLQLVIKKPGIRRLEEGADERFMEDLRVSMRGINKCRKGKDVKGNAFKMLQNIVDAN